MVIFFASYADAGIFDNVLNKTKKSIEGVQDVIDSIDKTVDRQQPAPTNETNRVEEPVKTTPKSVKSYDPGLVKNIQTQLNRLGYNAGQPDGVCGVGTRQAIQNFEKHQGLAVSGEPSPSLLERLNQMVQAKTKSNPDSPAHVIAKSDAEKPDSSEQKSEKNQSFAHTKEYEAVYEKCVTKRKWSVDFDCECLAQEVVALHSEQNPEQPFDDQLIDQYSIKIYRNGSCRNISETTRQEYASCMRGSGFDYRGIPQEDYCDCYAQNWGKFFGGYEGKIDHNAKNSLRLKARSYCYKPEAYKDK
jgi:peptidoglycan hydrolase-like protein with peptidoglycan-binding domain